MSDLYKVPPTMPVSELRKHPDVVFDKLKQTHVLLTRQGTEAGVLVHPTVWNRVLDYLDELEDLVEMLQAELALATGKDELITVDPETWKTVEHGRAKESHPEEEKILA